MTEIKTVLATNEAPTAHLLERRLHAINREIGDLKNKQRILTEMLKRLAADSAISVFDKNMWIDILRATGLDDEAMEKWHAEFEKRSPEGHHDFLLFLGIPENEVNSIRKWAGKRF